MIDNIYSIVIINKLPILSSFLFGRAVLSSYTMGSALQKRTIFYNAKKAGTTASSLCGFLIPSTDGT